MKIAYTFLVLTFLSFNCFAFSLMPKKTLAEGQYYHPSLSIELKRAIQANNTININLTNQGNDKKLFYIVLKDHKSNGYWEQLNLKRTLFPGVNELSFRLDRAVGERGSSKSYRLLERNKIKDIYFVFNPEERTTQELIEINQISFSSNLSPKKPSNVEYILFQEKSSDYPFATFVNQDTLKTAKNKVGFSQETSFWKSRNSQIAPKALAKSIGVLNGELILSLAPGEYQFELIWDELGYWDVPFWSKRSLSINGEMQRLETRSTFKSYLEDFSKYQNQSQYDHAFDLLLDKTFSPVTFKYKHKGGDLHLKFEGDATGVSLNSLMYYQLKNKNIASSFKKSLKKFYLSEFNQKYAFYNPVEEIKKNSLTQGSLSGGDLECNISHNKVFLHSSLKNLIFCLDSLEKDSKLKVIVSDFKNQKGDIISSDQLSLAQLEKGFKSLDMNHESYEKTWSHIINKPKSELNLSKGNNAFVLRLESYPRNSGIYKGKVSIPKLKLELDIQFSLLNSKLTESNTAFGFIGLSPVLAPYFKSDSLNSKIFQINLKVISEFHKMGLSLFTDPVNIYYQQNTKTQKFSLNDSELNQLLTEHPSKELFFYNGEFFKKLLNDHARMSYQSKEVFEKMKQKEIKRIVDKYSSTNLIYLYSDEATGYRNTVESDLKRAKELKKLLPGVKIGGFGDLSEWSRAKELYESWDYALYSDIPSSTHLGKLKNNFGVYNICAKPRADIKKCFGKMLFQLHQRKIKYYFEWHANSLQNYPDFDLDGREMDFALFKIAPNKELIETILNLELKEGLLVFDKLRALEFYINSRIDLGYKDKKLKRWLDQLKKEDIYPLRSKAIGNQKMSNFYRELDQKVQSFLFR